MSADAPAGNRLRDRFLAETTGAYDINDILATFWSLAVPLVEANISTRPTAPEAALESIYDDVVELDAESLERGGFVEADMVRLAELADQCDQAELTELANLLRLFLASIQSICANP